MLFQLGRIVGTPAALSVLDLHGLTPTEFLDRHISGDWGEVDREDDLKNFRSVKFWEQIVSAYKVGDDDRIWIITEADRSVTTILLPSEY